MVKIPFNKLNLNQKSYYYLRIQDFEADFPWKVSLKILNSGIILKTFTHVVTQHCLTGVYKLRLVPKGT